MCKTAFPTKEMQGSFDLRPLLYLRHLWYLSQSVSSWEWSFTIVPWELFLSMHASFLSLVNTVWFSKYCLNLSHVIKTPHQSRTPWFFRVPGMGSFHSACLLRTGCLGQTEYCGNPRPCLHCGAAGRCCQTVMEVTLSLYKPWQPLCPSIPFVWERSDLSSQGPWKLMWVFLYSHCLALEGCGCARLSPLQCSMWAAFCKGMVCRPCTSTCKSSSHPLVLLPSFLPSSLLTKHLFPDVVLESNKCSERPWVNIFTIAGDVSCWLMARLSTPRPPCFLQGGGGKQKENWGGVFLPSKWSEKEKVSGGIEHMAISRQLASTSS